MTAQIMNKYIVTLKEPKSPVTAKAFLAEWYEQHVDGYTRFYAVDSYGYEVEVFSCLTASIAHIDESEAIEEALR